MKGQNTYQKFQTEQRKLAAKEAKEKGMENHHQNRIDPLAHGKTLNELIEEQEKR